jgi:CRP-like cAMP-binding protein
MELITYLKEQLALDADLERNIEQAFRRDHYAKGHKITEPGTLSNKVYFIEKGLVRTYYVKNGKEITHHFFAENKFTMPIESIFYNRKSPYGIEVLESSIIRSVRFPTLEKHIDGSPTLEKFIRMLLIDVLKTFSDRLSALQFQSAQERYQTMLDQNPNILLRAPLGHIASYLGITQQTLSVIRAQK